MITVNAIVLNESFAFYSLASVAPYVDEIIVTDTGSEPEFIRPLEIAAETFSNLKLYKVNFENGGHEWKIRPGHDIELHSNFTTLGPKLSALRQHQNDEAKNSVIWLLDGDEIYSDKLAKYISQNIVPFFLEQPNIYCAHIPFIDFNSKTEIRQYHKMGRLFKRDNVKLVGDFPKDMFYAIQPDGNLTCLSSEHPNNINVNDQEGSVFHLETMLKPERKEYMKHSIYDGQWPEVIERYRDEKFAPCYKLIQKYGF